MLEPAAGTHYTAAMISPEKECEQLLGWHDGDTKAVYQTLTKGFEVIMGRTQTLLTLCTLTLTITGFSGPKIAASNDLSRWSMTGGLVFVLISILVALTGVLRIHWLSQFDSTDQKACIIEILRYRNRKTSRYVTGICLLVVGLTLYVVSVISYFAQGFG